MNAQAQSGTPAAAEREVEIIDGRVRLGGTLAVPPAPAGSVIFAHGSGSGRFSPRNIEVARRLHGAGLATLLFDLLTPDEAEDRSNVFAVELLAGRLSAATRWLRDQPEGALRMGYFGASTCATAALWATTKLRNWLAAVISPRFRPGLTVPCSGEVSASTLLVDGSADDAVLDLTRVSVVLLRCDEG